MVGYCRANVTCEHILTGNGCPPIQVVDVDEYGLCCGCPGGKVKNSEGICVHPDECRCDEGNQGKKFERPGMLKHTCFTLFCQDPTTR